MAGIQSLIVVALLYLVLKLAHLLSSQHVFKGFSVARVTFKQIKQKITAFLFDFGSFMGPFVEGEDKGVIESWRVAVGWLTDLHPMHD